MKVLLNDEHFDKAYQIAKILYSHKLKEEPSNYSAADWMKLYSVMNLQDGPLAGKERLSKLRNATVSNARRRWHIALLKGAWGHDQNYRNKRQLLVLLLMILALISQPRALIMWTEFLGIKWVVSKASLY